MPDDQPRIAALVRVHRPPWVAPLLAQELAHIQLDARLRWRGGQEIRIERRGSLIVAVRQPPRRRRAINDEQFARARIGERVLVQLAEDKIGRRGDDRETAPHRELVERGVALRQ